MSDTVLPTPTPSAVRVSDLRGAADEALRQYGRNLAALVALLETRAKDYDALRTAAERALAEPRGLRSQLSGLQGQLDTALQEASDWIEIADTLQVECDTLRAEVAALTERALRAEARQNGRAAPCADPAPQPDAHGALRAGQLWRHITGRLDRVDRFTGAGRVVYTITGGLGGGDGRKARDRRGTEDVDSFMKTHALEKS